MLTQGTMLCQAAWNNDLKTVKSIINLSDTFINAQNAKGQTALYCAAREGHYEIVDFLTKVPVVDLDAQVAEHGGTALHGAGFYQHASIVALLLARGANPGVKNKAGATPKQDARGKAIDVYMKFELSEVTGLIEAFPHVPQPLTARELLRKNFSGAEGLLTADPEPRQRGTGSSVARNTSTGEKRSLLSVADKDELFVVAPQGDHAPNLKAAKLVELEYSEIITDYSLRFRIAQFSSRFASFQADKKPAEKTPTQLPIPILSQLNRLLKPCPHYIIEQSSAEGKNKDNFVEGSNEDRLWYFQLFVPVQHANYLCTDKTLGPVAISVLEEKTCPYACTVIVRTKIGDILDVVYHPAKKKGPFPIHAVIRAITKQSERDGNPIQIFSKNFRLVKEARLIQSLAEFENSLVSRNYKFGILYAREGQTSELELFGNEHASRQLEEFLALMGETVPLLGLEGFNGGLDTSSKLSTGEVTLQLGWRNYNIIFHVSTMLPYDLHDTQNLARKRHLGNDIVYLIFQEGNTPLPPNVVSSMFNHVTIVVQPLEDGTKTLYRVSVASRDFLTSFGPPIPEPPIFEATEIRDFLVAKMINGERAACQAGQLFNTFQRTRLTLLADIEKTYEKTN